MSEQKYIIFYRQHDRGVALQPGASMTDTIKLRTSLIETGRGKPEEMYITRSGGGNFSPELTEEEISEILRQEQLTSDLGPASCGIIAQEVGPVTDDWEAQELKNETMRVSNAVYLGVGPCKTALDARLRIQALLEVALELMPQHDCVGSAIDQSYFNRINNFRPKVD